MVASSRLKVGSRVVGSHGPLIPNPNSQSNRRVRDKVTGTVMRSLALHEWEVMFDFDGKTRKVSSRSLKLVDDQVGIPLYEDSSEEPQQNTESVSIANSTGPPNVSIDTGPVEDPALNDAIDEDETLPLAVEAAEGDEDAVAEVEGEDSTPNNDFCFTEADFLESQTQMNDATRHLSTYKTTWDKIKDLEGTEVESKNAKDGSIKWKVVASESVTEDLFTDVRNKEHAFMDAKLLPVKSEEDFDNSDGFAKIFMKLWPNDMEVDRMRLNKVIAIENVKRKGNYQRAIKIVSTSEYIVFHALMIGASRYAEQGDRLWPDPVGKKKRRKGLSNAVDFGKYMMQWRFKEIKRYIFEVMQDAVLKESEDDWWPFKQRIADFNESRRELMYSSRILVFDESMSSYMPRTTKTGTLPNLSYVARKPEPLGTEFKNIVDGVTGVLLWLEIQEGKQRMSTKSFQELGSTSACVMRGVKKTAEFDTIPVNHDARSDEEPDSDDDSNEPRLFLGDAWFGSVKAAANVHKSGHHAIFNVKTAHSRSPKKYLDETMKDYPGGTWITLEGRADKEGVDLVSVGYKYNKKNVLTFVFTKGAGRTIAGKPYEARFPDKYGNVCVRQIARPEVVSTYFGYSNCVDLHNQARQYDLALEKKWITQNGYFRLYTTLVGWTVTDAWKINKISSSIPINQYADELAQDLIDYATSVEDIAEEMPEIETTSQSTSDSTDVSSLSAPQRCTGSHTKILLKDKKQLRCIWCSRVNLVHRKTTLKCKECGKGFCRDDRGLGCWSHHVALNGCPIAPSRGTKRKAAKET